MIRGLLPLAVLALAACEPPLEELYPPRFYTVSHATVPYEVRAQWDPFERGWFIRATSLMYPLKFETAPFVLSAIQRDVAPAICEGEALAIRQGEVWNRFNVKEALFLPDLGAFQFIGRCAEVPVTPENIAIFAPRGAAIAVHNPDAVAVEVDGDTGALVDPRGPSDIVVSVPAEGW